MCDPVSTSNGDTSKAGAYEIDAEVPLRPG